MPERNQLGLPRSWSSLIRPFVTMPMIITHVSPSFELDYIDLVWQSIEEWEELGHEEEDSGEAELKGATRMEGGFVLTL